MSKKNKIPFAAEKQQKGFCMNFNYQDLNMMNTGYGCSETYG